MSHSKPQRLATLAALAGGVMLAHGREAAAIFTYDSTTADGDPASTVTFKHDPDLGVAGVPALGGTFVGSGTLTPRTNPKSFTPTTTYPNTPSYQFAATQTIAGGSSSVSKASIAAVNNATTSGAKMQAGSGVTQTNKGAYSGASSMRTDFSFAFDGGEGFSPVSGMASFNVGGTVGTGAASFAQFQLFAEFIDENNDNSAMRSPINITKKFMRPPTAGATPPTGVTYTPSPTNGTFSALISSSELLNGTGFVNDFTRMVIVGFVEFQAFNASATSSSAGFSALADDPDTTTIDFTAQGGFGAALDGRLDLGVPEPATAVLSMLSLGAAGLGLSRRRKA